MAILSNQVKCNNCGDTPYSAFRHDFQSCKCGNIAVDGGMEYLRRVHADGEGGCEEMSIVIPDEMLEPLKVAVMDYKKNALGKVCNVFRVLRDSGFNKWPSDPVDSSRMREIVEIYAGMEGFQAESHLEKYLARIINQMYKAAIGVDG